MERMIDPEHTSFPAWMIIAPGQSFKGIKSDDAPFKIDVVNALAIDLVIMRQKSKTATGIDPKLKDVPGHKLVIDKPRGVAEHAVPDIKLDEFSNTFHD